MGGTADAAHSHGEFTGMLLHPGSPLLKVRIGLLGADGEDHLTGRQVEDALEVGGLIGGSAHVGLDGQGARGAQSDGVAIAGRIQDFLGAGDGVAAARILGHNGHAEGLVQALLDAAVDVVAFTAGSVGDDEGNLFGGEIGGGLFRLGVAGGGGFRLGGAGDGAENHQGGQGQDHQFLQSGLHVLSSIIFDIG